MLDIDTDVLRSCVAIAQQANEAVSEACNLLNQVVVHNDWACVERMQINENTVNNRQKALTLQSSASAFYAAVAQASARFDETEQENVNRVNQVEGLLSQMISVVPGISGGTSAPAISSFQDVSSSLGG